MNRQTFLRYLEQPARLRELPLTELQGLALEYPYSSNIRLLLLLRAKLEEHPALESYLSRCASASFDRSHLFDLMRDFVAEAPEERAEVLELIELDELTLEPLTARTADLPSRLNQELAAPLPRADPAPDVTERPIAPVTQRPEENMLKSADAVTDGWLATAIALSEVIQSGVMPPPARPEDPDHFAGRVSRRRRGATLGDRLRKLREVAVADPTPALDEIVHRSVIDHGAVVSETLAALLVRQEQYQNAIKMYRRLILLYPEKRAIFAGLIKELKEKL